MRSESGISGEMGVTMKLERYLALNRAFQLKGCVTKEETTIEKTVPDCLTVVHSTPYKQVTEDERKHGVNHKLRGLGATLRCKHTQL